MSSNPPSGIFRPKEATTDVLPNGYQTRVELDVPNSGKAVVLREVSITVFDVTIDLVLVLGDQKLESCILHAEKVRNVNSDGTVGKQIYSVTLSGNRQLVESQLFLAGEMVSISTTGEAVEFVIDRLRAAKGERGSNRAKAKVLPMIILDESGRKNPLKDADANQAQESLTP